MCFFFKTIVAACINAETGVGPSIASGNHVCNPICADLPTAPVDGDMHVTVGASDSQPATTISPKGSEVLPARALAKSLAVANTVE